MLRFSFFCKSSDQTLPYSFLCSTDQTSDWHLMHLRVTHSNRRNHQHETKPNNAWECFVIRTKR